MIDNGNTSLNGLTAEEAFRELFAIHRQLTSTSTYRDILRIFTESLRKRVAWFEVSIIVFLDNDKKAGNGEVIASTRIYDNKHFVIDLVKYPEIGAAVEKKEAVLIEDVGKAPLFDDATKALILSKGIRSLFVLPIFDVNDIISVVLISSREEIRMSPFLQTYYFMQANMLASAILNISRVNILEESMKKAYELLKIKEDYAFLFNNAMDGMMLIDREGKIKDVNRALTRLVGYSRQELIGAYYYKGISDRESLEKANRIFGGYLQKRFVHKFELDIETKSHVRKTVSVTASPLSGRDDVSLIALRDVTDEKTLSKELLKTTDLLLKTISSSPDAIIAVDTEGKLLFFNEEATRLFGYSSEEAVRNIPVTELYPPNVAKEIMRLLRESPTKNIRNYPTEVRNSSGDPVPVSLSGAIVYNEKGDEQMSVGYLRDEREKIRMERSLDEALSRLIEKEKSDAIMSLAGAAAHNLNQPLLTIQGYTELLANRLKKDDPVVNDYTSKITREVGKMADIIKQISRITRFDVKPYAGTASIADIQLKGRSGK